MAKEKENVSIDTLDETLKEGEYRHLSATEIQLLEA